MADKAEKIVTVAEYQDSMKAELAKQLLEDFGIRTVIVDQNTANLGLPPTLAMTAKLQVSEKDAARAREILESDQVEYNVDEPYDLDEKTELGGMNEQNKMNNTEEQEKP